MLKLIIKSEGNEIQKDVASLVAASLEINSFYNENKKSMYAEVWRDGVMIGWSNLAPPNQELWREA